MSGSSLSIELPEHSGLSDLTNAAKVANRFCLDESLLGQSLRRILPATVQLRLSISAVLQRASGTFAQHFQVIGARLLPTAQKRHNTSSLTFSVRSQAITDESKAEILSPLVFAVSA